MIEIVWRDFELSEFWWYLNEKKYDGGECDCINEQLYAQMMGWA